MKLSLEVLPQKRKIEVATDLHIATEIPEKMQAAHAQNDNALSRMEIRASK